MTGLLNNPRMQALALEELQFQNGKFFAELTAVFEKTVGLKAYQIPESGCYEELSRVIHTHTNFQITVVNSSQGPSVNIPMVNKNHPLFPTFMRSKAHNADGKRLIAEADGVVRGGVNLKTGKVFGIWAQLPATMHWPAELIAGQVLTPAELAAVTLHEIGHYFVYCEFVTRTVTTNYALAGLARSLDGSQGAEEREAVILSVTKALKLKGVDARVLAQTGNTKVIETVVITGVAQQIRSEIGSDYFDDRGFEYLADQYATRHGAALQMASAMDKFYQLENNRSYLTPAGYYWYEALKVALTLNPLTTVVMIFAGFAGLQKNAMHDTPEARFQRLRNQLVEQLKAPKLSEERYQALMADLRAMDQIMRQVHDRPTLFQVIAHALSGSDRLEQMQLQQELEKLAANDLFVKAQELRRLA